MQRIAVIALAVWGVVGVVLGGLLLAQHLVAMPAPSVDDTTMKDRLAQAYPVGRWTAFHVMYRACPCSRRTIEHLATSHRPEHIDEVVLMVDDERRAGDEDQRLRAAGFTVSVIAVDELARLHIEAAPTLVIRRPDGAIAYAGGYNRRKQSAAYEDIAIVDELRHDGMPSPLPIFGCPTSARLASAIDPLDLRSW